MNIKMLLLIIMVLFVQAHQWADAQVHHVVAGNDRAWHVASDIASWAAGRTFAVGDFLWFANPGGLNKDNVVELRSKEEFESCDVSNPMVTLNQGIDKILLQFEGNRYFASSNIESCKKGLKLPVEVKSKSMAQYEIRRSSTAKQVGFLAQEPSAPSSTTKIHGSIMMVVCIIIFSSVATIF